jgi:surface polysaccharide O-acyltransferase-like enzyme
MSRHFIYIDWLKSLAIIVVVLFHCGWFNHWLTVAFFPFAVPLFFVISGGIALQKDYDFTTVLRRNIHLLFIVAFWGALSTIICMYHRAELISPKIIISHVCSLDVPYCNHLWFLCSLIVLNFLQPFLREFTKTHSTRDVLIVWGLIGLMSFQGVNNFLRPISIMSNWNGYSLFYYLGGYLLMSNQLNSKRLPTWSILLMAIGGYSLMLIHNWLISTNEWWSNHFLHYDTFFDSYSTFPCAILTFSIFELFSRFSMKEISVITYISKHTLAIYVIHWVLLIPIYLLIDSIWVKPLILIILSLLLTMILERIPYVCRIVQNK